MNVTHTITGLHPRDGGPFKSVPGLARAQRDLGACVRVLSLEAHASLTAAGETGLEFRGYPRGWPKVAGRSPAMWRALKSTPGEVIHHHGLWHRTLHYATRKARMAGVPLILSPRGMMMPWAWAHRRWKKALAATLLHPGAFEAVAGWHATSEEEAAAIRRLGHCQPICIVPNGVDLPTPAELAVAKREWCKIEPRLAECRVALFYARFHAKKRLLECIDLWHDVAPAGWLLLVVGIPDEYTVSQLRRYMHAKGADRHIGIFDGTTMPAPYGISDLFLLPSHSENFGMSVAESLAAGVPVLCSHGAPWHELEAKQAGWCVSWERFPAALKQALMSPADTLRHLGGNGRTWMERDFAWRHRGGKLLEFYQTLHPPL